MNDKSEAELRNAITLCEFMGSDYEYNPSSWESLMSVVEKIESIRDIRQDRFVSHIGHNFCSIHSTRFRPNEHATNAYYNDSYGKNKKSAVHDAIVAFVNWHNINIKNK